MALALRAGVSLEALWRAQRRMAVLEDCWVVGGRQMGDRKFCSWKREMKKYVGVGEFTGDSEVPQWKTQDLIKQRNSVDGIN